MKLRKKALLATAGATLLLSTQVFAAATWDTCDIDRIGLAGIDSQIFKAVNCGVAANEGKWLKLVEQKKNYFATLLTASALGSAVRIKADFDIATTNANPSGNIYNMYLINN